MIVLGFCLGVGILIGLALMHRPKRKSLPRRADPLRIHDLEYKLGFRDDPPPRAGDPALGAMLAASMREVTGTREITMGPGIAIPVNGNPCDIFSIGRKIDGGIVVAIHPEGLTMDREPTWRPFLRRP